MSDERCPTCGSDPDDDTIHLGDCPRIGTCGQYGPPWLDEPWHADDPPLVSRMAAPGDLTDDEWEEQFVKPWREGLRVHASEHRRIANHVTPLLAEEPK